MTDVLSPEIIAHRAFTPEAIDEAAANGYVAELDVRSTVYGALLVVHGVDQHGVENDSDPDAFVEVGDKLVRIATLTNRDRKAMRADGIDIPTFQEVREIVNDRVPLNIDSKDQIAGGMLLDKLGDDFEGIFCLGSFHEIITRKLRAGIPDGVPTALTLNELFKIYLAKPEEEEALKQELPANGRAQVPMVFGDIRVAEQAVVDKLHRLDVPADFWTVNDPRDWRKLVDLGVDGIITDDPNGLKSFIEQ